MNVSQEEAQGRCFLSLSLLPRRPERQLTSESDAIAWLNGVGEEIGRTCGFSDPLSWAVFRTVADGLSERFDFPVGIEQGECACHARLVWPLCNSDPDYAEFPYTCSGLYGALLDFLSSLEND
ncbi:MAG: hypothetical protein AB7W28_01575 [Armatimonadota bacterium]